MAVDIESFHQRKIICLPGILYYWASSALVLIGNKCWKLCWTLSNSTILCTVENIISCSLGSLPVLNYWASGFSIGWQQKLSKDIIYWSRWFWEEDSSMYLYIYHLKYWKLTLETDFTNTSKTSSWPIAKKQSFKVSSSWFSWFNSSSSWSSSSSCCSSSWFSFYSSL